jgi:ABC-type antimicrobial peptide transport system permease subunit
VAALGLVLVVLTILLLSTAGIYALMSFNVTQRRREIGIRSALGGQPHHVLRGVLARADAQLGIGVAVGLTAAVLLECVTHDQLILVSPGSPTAAAQPGSVLLPATTAALVLCIGLAAALGPARRGLRIQPTDALRDGE